MDYVLQCSLGNCGLVVKINVGLIRKLDLTESVVETMTRRGTTTRGGRDINSMRSFPNHVIA